MKKNFHRIVALLLTVLLLLSFAACGSGNDAEDAQESTQPSESAEDSPSESESADNAGTEEGIVAGSVFKYWSNQDYPSYLPWIDNRNSTIALQLYDNLLYQYHGDTEDIRGALAESWTSSDDGLTWVFQIRQDAKFATGNPVTAEAFVTSWDYAKEYQPRFFSSVASYEATGEYELTITLSSADPTFLYKLPLQPQAAPVDPELLEQYGGEANEAAMGAGPYYVESYTSGEKFVLKANPYYNHPDRMPQIETLEIVIIPDENTALIALMNGEIDIMNTVNLEVYNTLTDKGWDVITAPDRVNPFWMNAKQVEIFRDATVREALCHMIDWQAVADLVYDGLWPAATSDYEGMDTPYGDEHSYDPELGLQMLEEAGYKPEDISFELLADGDSTDVIIAVQAQLQELGLVNVDAVTLDGATCYGMLKSGEYETIPTHNGFDPLSPLTPFTMGLAEDGTQRVMWIDYMDEEVYAEALEIYDKAVAATTWDEYKGYVQQLIEIEQSQCCSLGGLYWQRFICVNPEFTEIYPREMTGIPEICYLRIAE